MHNQAKIFYRQQYSEHFSFKQVNPKLYHDVDDSTDYIPQVSEVGICRSRISAHLIDSQIIISGNTHVLTAMNNERRAENCYGKILLKKNQESFFKQLQYFGSYFFFDKTRFGEIVEITNFQKAVRRFKTYFGIDQDSLTAPPFSTSFRQQQSFIFAILKFRLRGGKLVFEISIQIPRSLLKLLTSYQLPENF